MEGLYLITFFGLFFLLLFLVAFIFEKLSLDDEFATFFGMMVAFVITVFVVTSFHSVKTNFYNENNKLKIVKKEKFLFLKRKEIKYFDFNRTYNENIIN